ncbi:MAG: CAP domain-containing protein [Candidatus Moraniibacteriota bacterium]
MKKPLLKLNFLAIAFLTVGAFLSLFSPNFSLAAPEINNENVLKLINSSRLDNNLLPLIENATLSKVAQSKATDMVQNHYFSHTSPQGITPWYWFNKNQYHYKYAGENLAINYLDPQEEHLAWMDSPAHRKNILNPNFSEIGIARNNGIINNKKSVITVTVFGTPEKKVLGSAAGLNEINKKNYQLTTVSKNSIIETTKDQKMAWVKIDKRQSDKLTWTLALIIMLLISKDLVIKTIYSKKFQQRHAFVNLILFVVLYSVLF